MILDKLENADWYFGCVPGFQQFMKFFNDNDLEELPACKIKLDGQDLIVNICDQTPKDEKDCKLEAHKDYIDIQKNTEKQIERENLEKISELFEEEEQSAKESAKERAENVQKEIEIRQGDFLYPQIIKSSIRPFYGRMIKGKIIPLNTVEYDSGRVTVWGDIFDIEKKVTKSGDKNIFTIDTEDWSVVNNLEMQYI